MPDGKLGQALGIPMREGLRCLRRMLWFAQVCHFGGRCKRKSSSHTDA
jgi:hypothetical protein